MKPVIDNSFCSQCLAKFHSRATVTGAPEAFGDFLARQSFENSQLDDGAQPRADRIQPCRRLFDASHFLHPGPDRGIILHLYRHRFGPQRAR